MKLVVVLMVVSFLQVSAAGYGQKITLNHKKASLEQVLREIRKQTGFFILCDGEILEKAKPLNVKFENTEIEKVLSICLQDQPFDYAIDNKTVIISWKSGAGKESGEASASRITTIKGRVTDQRGEPLPGVSVKIKGEPTGVVTDIQGTFSINVQSDNQVLVFTYVGFAPREVPVKGKSTIEISLKEQVTSLNEIVVVGYGTQKKSDVNAAIVSVKPEQIDRTAQPAIDQMLQGQAAGLTVFNSSQPGGGVSLFIRGQTSTGAGNGPLVVIDGFPVIYDAVEPGSGNKYNMGGRGALNDINPNDIASIEILKDASATAIYGARASNGVILITTKRAKAGVSVDYSFNTSYQSIAKKPELLNAREYMTEQNNYLYELYLLQNNLPPYGNKNPSDVPPFVARNTEQAIAAAGTGTNWYDLITQTGNINQHNLSISQGNDNIKALFSFNYFNQKGVVKESGLERYSFRLNLDQKITKWWDYGISATYAFTKAKNSQLGGGRDADAGIIETALNYSPLIKAERDPLTNKWIEDPNQPLLGNPLSFLDIRDETEPRRLLGSIFSNVYLTKDLWVKLNMGADIRNSLRQGYFPKTTRYGSQVNGEAIINRAERNDYVLEGTLNYRKDFGTVHNIQAVAGYSYQNYNGRGSGTRAQNFSSDLLGWDALQAGSQRPSVSSYRDRHVLASYFSRIQYSYSNKYLLTFSGRVDGSDRFGANNRYAFFPSGAFAWRVIEEPFMKGKKPVSDLKLRLSVGKVGNENIPNDAASEYFGFNNVNYYFNGNLNTGVSLTKLGNPNLKWESTTEYNLGIDFGFFNNRLAGSADVYYKQVDDLLSNRSLPQSSVVGSIPWNVGTTQGKGLEITINSINIVKPFRWSSALTYTSYQDRWKKRDPKVMLQPYQGETDELTSVFTLIPDGIKQPGESTPAMPGLLPGQQKYKDIRGLDAEGNLTGVPDGKINQADVQLLGTTAPDFSLGLNNTFEYKGFDLNFFFYGSFGGLKWPSTRMEHSVYGSYGTQRFKDNFNFLKEVQDRWTSSNTDTEMPGGEVNSFDAYGAPYWEKSSYLRLKTITLGYNLARTLIRSKFLRSSRLYVGAQNLFTITDYKGLDPETEYDRASYPQQRTFSLGLDLKF
ncbi:SusC/RagA family TonB-linked outer membrane protein [Pararcticibacter amylolyticus]|nr:TonB-dependent receptor [Pararcticibacter amylolyticus]